MSAQKNHLIEMFLLSARNICFGWEIEKYFLVTHLFGSLEKHSLPVKIYHLLVLSAAGFIYTTVEV